MVIIKNSKDFETKIEMAGPKLVVIDFFAKWCGPCKEISPLLNHLASSYKSEAVVLKVDVEKCEDIAHKYKISSMPTFLFMKGKRIVGKFTGADSDNLKNYFAKFTR